jgi:hypothetical protein
LILWLCRQLSLSQLTYENSFDSGAEGEDAGDITPHSRLPPHAL